MSLLYFFLFFLLLCLVVVGVCCLVVVGVCCLVVDICSTVGVCCLVADCSVVSVWLTDLGGSGTASTTFGVPAFCCSWCATDSSCVALKVNSDWVEPCLFGFGGRANVTSGVVIITEGGIVLGIPKNSFTDGTRSNKVWNTEIILLVSQYIDMPTGNCVVNIITPTPAILSPHFIIAGHGIGEYLAASFGI